MIGGKSLKDKEMGLTRLSKACRECKYVDTCENKRMEALAYLSEAFSVGGVNAAASVMQPHDYRDIKIGINTTITIDLEEIKKELAKSIYPNYLQLGG